jgi:hypothetical protein
MEYSFVRTTNGPAVVSADEVLFFTQYVALQDYVEDDPEFIFKAKAFLSEAIVDLAETLAMSLHTAVAGVEFALSIHQYIAAIHHINNFETFIRQQQSR